MEKKMDALLKPTMRSTSKDAAGPGESCIL